MKWPARRMESQKGKGFGMFEIAARLEADGADIIHLEFGRPSFDTPAHIKEATKKALDDGVVHYGDISGDIELRESLAKKLTEFNGVDTSPDQILITNGLTQASMAVFEAGVDPGDEVVMTDPFYPQHPAKVGLVGGETVTFPLAKEENWRLDGAALEEIVSEKTSMICLINPANPVGRVFTPEELSEVARVAIEKDLLVVTDEVYEYITFDGNRHVSIASLPGMAERTISLFAFTKAYAMDGWRMGYAAGPEHLIADLRKVTMNQSTHPNVFAQKGALAAVLGPHEPVDEMVAEDKRRRDLLCSGLNEIDGVDCPTPEATIYAFPDMGDLGMTSNELAKLILAEAHVAVESGAFYGRQGEGHLRICFGSEPYERLEEAVDRIQGVLERL